MNNMSGQLCQHSQMLRQAQKAKCVACAKAV